MDYVALKEELETDPLGLGYSTPVDPIDPVLAEADAALLNSLTTGRTRNRTIMTGREFKDNWDSQEFSVLTDAEKSLLYSMAARDDLDPFGVDADVVLDIFPPNSTTRDNLAAARVETISRAEELLGSLVHAGNVQTARTL